MAGGDGDNWEMPFSGSSRSHRPVSLWRGWICSPLSISGSAPFPGGVFGVPKGGRSAGAPRERGEGRGGGAGHGAPRWLIMGPCGTIPAHPSLFSCLRSPRGCRAPRGSGCALGAVHASPTPRNRRAFQPGGVKLKVLVRSSGWDGDRDEILEFFRCLNLEGPGKKKSSGFQMVPGSRGTFWWCHLTGVKANHQKLSPMHLPFPFPCSGITRHPQSRD